MLAKKGCCACREAERTASPQAWLRRVLQDGRVPIGFQPIVYTAEPNRVFAYEALIVDQLPDGTLRFPARLYATARETSSMLWLDEVARCSALAVVAAQAVPAVIALNLSPASVHADPTCPRSPLQQLAAFGLAPQQVILELTSEREGDLEQLTDVVASYRAAGCRVALDDLGTGHGPLVALPAVQPDFIKLDKALVHGVDRTPYLATITAGLVGTAQALGVPVIAEGVETAQELAWLRERGARFAQGFYTGRVQAVPA